MKMIPYGRQDINSEDISSVIEVLRSDFLTQGPKVPFFEDAIKDYCKVQYAVAVNSATSALHLACMALGLGPGDVLWTSPISFVASANCGLYCGANVDFVDIDLQTYNLCPLALEQKLIEAKKKNRLPKVVIPVHLSGQSCNMKAIHRLSIEYGFKVIEDASHAIGAKYLGRAIGNCEYSDITVFSFHPVKIITTAEGGMATTNDPFLAGQMRLLRTHGIEKDSHGLIDKEQGAWYYEQQYLGFNYRLTDLQAALGISQMNRLDAYVTRRHEIAKRYDDAFEGMPIASPWQSKDCLSSYHLYIIRPTLEEIGKTRLEIFNGLREQGVMVNVHYIPIYLHPFYKNFGYQPKDYPNAQIYYSNCISIPLFPSMLDEDCETVISSIKKVIPS